MIERIWFSQAWWARAIRGVLTPFSWLFGFVVRVRNRRYDTGRASIVAPPIFTVSIGNLTVGGTGKTPVVAWLANTLAARGRRPAIVLRGYGDDEPQVHAQLAPHAAVYVNPDRATGIAQAAREGADIALLDDAFQHRRAGRNVDIVLASADRASADRANSDRWQEAKLLPAGPFREPLSALRRASLVFITHKAARDTQIVAAEQVVARVAPKVPVYRVHLALGELVALGDPGRRLPLNALVGAPVLLVAGVGDPGALQAQLKQVGARVTPFFVRDHHPYTAADAAHIAARAKDHKYILTTLKDAVKLAKVWREKDLQVWYLSQVLTVNDAGSLIDHILAAGDSSVC